MILAFTLVALALTLTSGADTALVLPGRPSPVTGGVLVGFGVEVLLDH